MYIASCEDVPWLIATIALSNELWNIDNQTFIKAVGTDMLLSLKLN